MTWNYSTASHGKGAVDGFGGTIKRLATRAIISHQGRSEGTSSVAFEVLIINCQIYLINLLIFNCLTLTINLFINLFYVKFLFSKNHIFCKQKRTAVYGRASLVSDFELTRKNDDLLSSRHK